MSQYALRLPDDLYQRAAALADEEGVSLNQFFLYAISQMVAEVEARRFFQKRSNGLGEKQARKQLDGLLAKVSDQTPVPGDELSTQVKSGKHETATARVPTK